MPQPKLGAKSKWVDIKKVDEKWYLRDFFFQENILAGADSVGKLMAVTYLTQFRNVDGEFARRPVYAPDFHIGYIPYSSSLLQDLENVASRGQVFISGVEGRITLPQVSPAYNYSRHFFLETGAQLVRLYHGNARNLESLDDSKLYNIVRRLWFRDRKLRRAYTTRAFPGEGVY